MKNCKKKNLWGIITTLKCDAQQTIEFVNYYLNNNVDYILLYFDNPDDPAIILLQDQVKITCIPCTESHWNTISLVEHKCVFERKQLSNIRQGKEILKNKGIQWAISVDSDELLYVFGNKNITINRLLSEQNKNIGAIRIRPYEAVVTRDQYNYRIFRARWFKVRLINDNLISLFLYKLLHYNVKGIVNKGFFLGHTQGKTFFRTKLEFDRVNQHNPTFKSNNIKYIEFTEIGLLHFDCMLYEKWKERWLWRVSGGVNSIGMGEQRLKQFWLITNAVKSKNDNKLKKLYQKWFFVSKSRLFLLRIVDQIKNVNIDNKMFNNPVHFKK